jgi:hypothetical protein
MRIACPWTARPTDTTPRARGLEDVSKDTRRSCASTSRSNHVTRGPRPRSGNVAVAAGTHFAVSRLDLRSESVYQPRHSRPASSEGAHFIMFFRNIVLVAEAQGPPSGHGFRDHLGWRSRRTAIFYDPRQDLGDSTRVQGAECRIGVRWSSPQAHATCTTAATSAVSPLTSSAAARSLRWSFAMST